MSFGKRALLWDQIKSDLLNVSKIDFFYLGKKIKIFKYLKKLYSIKCLCINLIMRLFFPASGDLSPLFLFLKK